VWLFSKVICIPKRDLFIPSPIFLKELYLLRICFFKRELFPPVTFENAHELHWTWTLENTQYMHMKNTFEALLRMLQHTITILNTYELIYIVKCIHSLLASIFRIVIVCSRECCNTQSQSLIHLRWYILKCNNSVFANVFRNVILCSWESTEHEPLRIYMNSTEHERLRIHSTWTWTIHLRRSWECCNTQSQSLIHMS